MAGCLDKFITVAALALAFGGSSAARAQTYIPLSNTTTAETFVGLSVSISGCSYTLNAVAQTSCASDGLDLEQVSDGRGKVELEIVPSSGSAIFSAASGASSGNVTSVTYLLTVTTNTPASAAVTSYALNLAGTNRDNTQNNFYVNTAGGATQITASILNNAAAASCSTAGYGSGSPLSCVYSLTPSSTLSINAGLAIGGPTNSSFTLNSASYVFTTAPEPASLFLLATGAGGLAAIRRRPRIGRA